MKNKRIRDYGIAIGRYSPGEKNSITDVPGITVGHKTNLKGDFNSQPDGPIARTGVSIVYPHSNIWTEPVYSGTSILNGNGELTGAAWVEESGLLTTPIALTNTHSVGVVRDAIIEYYKNTYDSTNLWMLPVVTETWDGYLSDINGMHVTKEDTIAALENAQTDICEEGNVGGGTGMTCFEFKGGIGTSSRIIDFEDRKYVLGALVQANFGLRYQLTVQGVPIGRLIPTSEIPGREDKKHSAVPRPVDDTGSIIVILATNVPLLPHQCKRLARRASLGLARTGSVGANNSGDIFIAFSTGNICKGFLNDSYGKLYSVKTVTPETMSELFEAAIEVTEEAILNALCSAETMTGIKGRTIYSLPMEKVTGIMAECKKF